MLFGQVAALDDATASISGHLSLTGAEFMEMAPANRADAVARLNVFSRVEPSHKTLLVNCLREQVPPACSLHYQCMEHASKILRAAGCPH